MKKPSSEMVDAFLDWFNQDPHSSYEDHYSNDIKYENLSNLPQQQFIDFFFNFARDGGKIQSGGHRTAGKFRETIESNYDSFRQFIFEPFESKFDEIQWLERSSMFPFFGKGLATIYLNRVDKYRFAILNNKAIEAMKLFGNTIPSDLSKQYLAIKSAEKQLIDWYPKFDNFFRTDSLTHYLIGTSEGSKWKNIFSGNSEEFTGSYWIYAPGEKARKWQQYLDDGLMGIGWDDLPYDLSKYNESELRKEYDNSYKEKATDIDFKQLVDFVFNVKIGDRIFVKQGTTVILGFGEVSSDYFYDKTQIEYRHLRKVKWIKSGSWTISNARKKLPVKTLTKLSEQTRIEEYMNLTDGVQIDEVKESAFSSSAFELLNGLRNNPTAKFYKENVDSFKANLEKPFQELLKKIAEKLPDPMLDGLETEKGTIARIIKNDYGKGGAWDYYWGAFYPKEGKRIEDPQLFIWMNCERIVFGFYIGDYGAEQRLKFIKNCKLNQDIIIKLLNKNLSNQDIAFGGSSDDSEEFSGQLYPQLSFDEWLDQIESTVIHAGLKISKNDVLAISADELAEKMAKLFIDLYPLFYLATSDAPISKIKQFLDIDNSGHDDVNPDYSLDECSEDTFLSIDQLRKWLNAISRKKQAIFYGPPGTGKTFLAEKLARHLIGGDNGIMEIVQFHPSYSYEDFMQGLRPKALADGGLEYVMTPGRFKDFCDKATERKGISVLIIDEINRANLSKVLGELMFLLEYRSKSIPLAGGKTFKIPDSVRIIGTMNTADRSIALVDHALRRRFAFISLYPDYEILRQFHNDNKFNPDGLVNVLQRLNNTINDRHYSVGISYFLSNEIENHLEDVWQMEIEPYIEEIFFDQPQKAEAFSWNNVKAEIFK